MSRRVLGALAATSVVFMSWMALSQPRSSSAPGGARPANLMAPVFRAGIAPAPGGAAGHYLLQHRHASALFTDTGMAMRLPSRTSGTRELGWSVAGGRAVNPRTEKPRKAKLHRMVGPRETWEKNLPTYGGLRYPGVKPGVDLWFEERPEGVEYGFRAERGADLRRVGLEYSGAREVRVVEEGRALEVVVGEGVLREQGLQCAQEQADGRMKPVGCRFTDARPVARERWAYAIEVDVEDPERPVVVDPLVLWNTYLGGPGPKDILQAIQQNDKGELFIVGTTAYPPDSALPGVHSRFGALGGQGDVFVAKFQADGGLEWWTLFGGRELDIGTSLVLGREGELFVAGFTQSPVFEWTRPDGSTERSDTLSPGIPPTGPAAPDGFVARLDSTGTQLDWFVRIGGNGNDLIFNMIQGSGGRLFVAGLTTSNNMPGVVGTPGPILGEDGFIASVDPSLHKVEGTLLIQGDGDDAVMSLTPKGNDSLYITGYYSDFPGGVTNPYLAVISGVSRGTPSVRSHVPFGSRMDEDGLAVTLKPGASGDKVWVWGTTYSRDFPGAGQVKGESDIFVTEFTDDGSSLSSPLRTTLLGGFGKDVLSVVALDKSQRVYLGGFTSSSGLPADGGFDTQLEDNSFGDGFVARVRLEPEPALEWVSYVGGTGEDQVFALQVDNQNPDRLFIGGATDSQDLRYSDKGYDTSVNGSYTYNMFLLAADLNATPGNGTNPDDDTNPGGDTDDSELSPLGWSCGSTGGGPGALALGSLAGLALLASRRRKARA